MRCLDRKNEADEFLAETLALDPLDWLARDLRGDELSCDMQVRLDLALDYACAGFYRAALGLLAAAQPEPHSGTAPMVEYYRAWLICGLAEADAARRAYLVAAVACPDYCFPARLEEIAIFQTASTANPNDARALLYLGTSFTIADATPKPSPAGRIRSVSKPRMQSLGAILVSPISTAWPTRRSRRAY